MPKADSRFTIDIPKAIKQMSDINIRLGDLETITVETVTRMSQTKIVGGELVVAYIPDAEYNPNFRYLMNETCSLNGVIYVAQRATKGDNPLENPTVWVAKEQEVYELWEDISDGSSIKANKIVRGRDGNLYICVRKHNKSEVFAPESSGMHWDLYTG